MKYTPMTIAKALFAFVTAFTAAATAAAHGTDLSVLDIGQWLTAIGAGLVGGGGVFAIPNKSADPAVSPAEQVVKSVQEVLTNQANAVAELNKVKDSVAAAVGAGVPGFGPLAAQVINSVNLGGPPTAYSQNYSGLVHPYDR